MNSNLHSSKSIFRVFVVIRRTLINASTGYSYKIWNVLNLVVFQDNGLVFFFSFIFAKNIQKSKLYKFTTTFDEKRLLEPMTHVRWKSKFNKHTEWHYDNCYQGFYLIVLLLVCLHKSISHRKVSKNFKFQLHLDKEMDYLDSCCTESTLSITAKINLCFRHTFLLHNIN
jgi:hypothetical protein